MCTFYRLNLHNVHIPHLGHRMYTFYNQAIECMHSTAMHILYNIYIYTLWPYGLLSTCSVMLQWQAIETTIQWNNTRNHWRTPPWWALFSNISWSSTVLWSLWICKISMFVANIFSGQKFLVDSAVHDVTPWQS